jgi:hypothetical protein
MTPPHSVTWKDLINSKPLQPVRRDEVTVFGKAVTMFIGTDEFEMACYVGRLRDSTRVTADIHQTQRKLMLDKGSIHSK